VILYEVYQIVQIIYIERFTAKYSVENFQNICFKHVRWCSS